MRAVGTALCCWLAIALFAGAPSAPAQTCSEEYTGSCGPSFVLPGWGDADGWTNPEQYQTIQLADVDGDGADELLGRTPAGLAIHVFDKALGQWRPQVDGQDKPNVLDEFADPPPLTAKNPTAKKTDWRTLGTYNTIQTADIDGDKRAEILARGADGVIVFDFTPDSADPRKGSWRQLSTSGPFPLPSGLDLNSLTIQTGDFDGDGGAELLGRDTNGNIEMYWWRRSDSTWQSWNELELFPSAGFGSYLPLNVARLRGGAQQALVGHTRFGVGAYRLRFFGSTPFGMDEPFSDLAGFGDCPFTAGGTACLGSAPAYYATLQFGDLDGNGAEEIIARASDGLRAYRYQGTFPGSWGALPTLSALADANGFTAARYWETIQTADIQGDGRAEVLARTKDGLHAWSYDPATRSWTELAGTLALADDPWGNDPSYYSTIQTGDVDGDGHADVIARGPYGIRTWFYNRRGTGGWERYLEEGYPEFTGNQKTAFDKLNEQLKAAGGLPASAATVRSLWTGDTAPTVDRLRTLRDQIVDTAKCTGGTGTPTQYADCTPPGGSGITAQDWTATVNAVLAEAFWAETVVDYFTELQSLRGTLFLEQNAQLPAIAGDLELEAAEHEEAEFDMKEMFSGIFGIAGALAGLIPEGEPAAAALEVTGEALSMIPSASESLTQELDGTYADLKKELANSIAEVDKIMDEHSELVRQDHALLTLVGQLRSRGTWTLDRPGMLSAGRQGFAASVYRALLPTLYARFNVTKCLKGAQGRWGTVEYCDAPAPGAPGVAGSPPESFSAIGTPPTVSGIGTHHPCQTPERGVVTCEFKSAVMPSGLATKVWGKQGERCAYDGTASHEWTFDCSLGVDPDKSVTAAPPSLPEEWDFRTYTGDPFVDVNSSGPMRVSGNAGTAGVRLTGTLVLPRRVRLDRARVTRSRVLFEPGGARELVRHPGGRRLSPAVLTRQPGGNRLHGTYIGKRRGGPTTRLRLWRKSTRRLGFRLRLNGARITPPAACHHALAASEIPMRLHTLLRIDDGRGRPLTLSMHPRWECRRNRLGTVRRLVVRTTPRPAPKPGGLAIALRGPRRAAAGTIATYRITVRNRRRTPVHDLLVRAILPPRLTARRARGHQVYRRYARLAPGRSKTFPVRARIADSAGGAKRLTAVALAIDARPAAQRFATVVAKR